MMTYMINHPRLLCLACMIAMWLMALLGVWLRLRFVKKDVVEDKDSLQMVVSATLTLLGLIIGFAFSMATTHYDQRRLFEEQEANAIGTEYVRAGLLDPAQTASVKNELSDYLNVRIRFYQTDYGSDLTTVNNQTAAGQTLLWNSIKAPAAATPTPIMALVVSGMNDVLNSQGYTQFAFWNRIPQTAWGLMIIISLFANLLVGYGTRRTRSGNLLLLVLPVIVSVSFFLIADIDSPRGGLIRIQPRDLQSLAQSIARP